MARNTPYFVGLVLFVTFLLSAAMTPTKKIADDRPKIDLETMIPKEFGDWKMVDAGSMVLVSPDVQAKLDLIYNQTLSRTYINEEGERIMLAIAYGGNQSDSMQVHKPEVCYPAQGFQIVKQEDSVLEVLQGSIPVRRLIARQGSRLEPVTYWVRMGDIAVIGGLEQKLAKMSYTLIGKIPDGLLFRVSNIGLSEKDSYQKQDHFINQMLVNTSVDVQAFLVGRVTQG